MNCVSSAAVKSSGCIVQLWEFQVLPHPPLVPPRSPKLPSPDIGPTSPSDLDPSSRQNGIGAATTIQLPHCTRGDIPSDGLLPETSGVPPKQNAAPIPRVRVGVTNTRKKFDAAEASVPRDHHAHCPLHPVPRTLSGHTDGIQYPDTGIQVIPAKMGIPVLTLSPASGIPNTLGESPGASGAQLIGILIHPPPPNPHESQLAISSAVLSIFSMNPASNPIFTSSPF